MASLAPGSRYGAAMKLFLYNPMASVREFHRKFRVLPFIELDSEQERSRLREQRIRLITEEADEVAEALADGNLNDLAKELADLLYVTYGTAELFDIPLPKVFNEVHRSNLSKLGEDGKPIYREDGKVLKGPGYEPANVEGVLAEEW